MVPAGHRGAIADNDDKVVLQEKFQGRVGGPRKVISINMLRQEGARKEPSIRGEKKSSTERQAMKFTLNADLDYGTRGSHGILQRLDSTPDYSPLYFSLILRLIQCSETQRPPDRSSSCGDRLTHYHLEQRPL